MIGFDDPQREYIKNQIRLQYIRIFPYHAQSQKIFEGLDASPTIDRLYKNRLKSNSLMPNMRVHKKSSAWMRTRRTCSNGPAPSQPRFMYQMELQPKHKGSCSKKRKI